MAYHTRIPQPRIDYLIRSEYIALKFLETTNVSTPQALNNGIVGDYILMEPMAGKTRSLESPKDRREKRFQGLQTTKTIEDVEWVDEFSD